MMGTKFDGNVFIIGAGPYGLSLAAHLTEAGVPFEIAGTPMASWRYHMPAGMYLKSEPYASSLSDPKARYNLERYRLGGGRRSVRTGEPVALNEFLDYTLWFQERALGAIIERHVRTLARADDNGFELTLDDGSLRRARHVVLASGIIPFKHVPEPLSALPSELVSHSADHASLAEFARRQVSVVGTGQSGLETAALLHEAGARTHLVARAPALKWHVPPAKVRAFWDDWLRPEAGIANGWGAWICAEHPGAFRQLPLRVRAREVATRLGPCGAWWLRSRVEGKVAISTASSLEDASERNGRVALTLRVAGTRTVIEADHVIAATGYRVDMRRLGFLDPALLAELATDNGYPRLNGRYETSVPGLFAVGSMAAQTFGPVMRFMYGARHPAGTLARHFAALATGQPVHGQEVASNTSASIGAAASP
jgi:thioredoxin reductase